MLQKLLSLLVLLLCCSLIQTARAQCNACVEFSACVSKTEFKLCSDGVPSGNATSCNPGQVCSVRGICQGEADSTAVVACQDCNKCDVNSTFACTGTHEFALCLGESEPTAIKGKCDEDTFCNIDNPYICGKAENAFPPTCSYTDDVAPSTTTTTTTPSPSLDPNSYCGNLKKRGRYPAGTNPDTTCRQYVLCLQNNDAWIGVLYYCPNDFYFNTNTRGCDGEIPPRCNGLIRGLSIYGIEFY